ncbi:MAG: APC family permease [Terriglobales bacterium]
MSSTEPQSGAPRLARELTVKDATVLNMIDMIGVGPFITLPLVVGAMGGPQAMLGWVLGALLAVCDGLVWAELGAAFPGAGGSYQYLSRIYGPSKWGRLFAFLFVWQISFSAPLSIASGAVGVSQYAAYLFPALESSGAAGTFWGSRIAINGISLLAIGLVLFSVLLLMRGIRAVSKISWVLWAGVMATLAWVIFSGFTHVGTHQIFAFPPDAFALNHKFFLGLGSALIFATYDYWGYYNVCFLGGEVKDPERTIPRSLLLSIVLVGIIYMALNLSVVGVLPWKELQSIAATNLRFYTVSTVMQRIYGNWAGSAVTLLVIWTGFASIFSLLLGYSRVPYAAALDGNYFKRFAAIHPRYHIPHVALLSLGFTAAFFCLFRLRDLIAALVVIRVCLQFLLQGVGLIFLRARHPEAPRPFRMWLYPLPALLSVVGFTFLLVSRENFSREIKIASIIAVSGAIIFLLRGWKQRTWPFTIEPLEATSR